MIFINCFILIAHIGFYFDTKKNRKYPSLPKSWQQYRVATNQLFITWRNYLQRRYFGREMTKRNVIIWRTPVRLPEIVNGRNPTNNDLFDHI